ncbi:MAG: ABC transporter permease, partial [Bacteroidales bacterium]|nr:ABC transporter permease [Bacteroidales bacterium]
MISITNIRSVARYEAKTLRRSWLFRLFAVASLIILAIMNIAVFSPVGEQDWESLAIPATIPHINLYLLNLAQALIIIFLASDFIKRDKKLDTNEVLYTRPVSNFEYIIGKTTGILKLFIGLNLIILLIALIVNITANNTRVDIAAYLTHLLIISVPTLIYSLGLAYVIMSLVKNQAITFLLLLGYAALNLFYLWYRAGFIFDYMLFGMPVFKSAVTGYSNIWPIIAHRLLYTSLGVAFIMITILTFKRLPHSRPHAVLATVLLVVSIITAIFSGISFNRNHTSLAAAREKIMETNSRYENALFVTITDATVALEHKGEEIDATAILTCNNRHDEPAEQLIFSLNPSLTVTTVTLNGQNANWERDHHILLITPPAAPGSNEEFEVSISYNGTIEEEYTHPWHDPDYRMDNYKLAMINIEPRQAYVTEEFLLLTPETGWYPVAGLNFYPTNPARQKVDFTTYSLKVKSGEGMVPVSQGRMTKDGDNYLFRGENPL